jgi:DNA repair protein RecO (recombination protein O)
VAPPKTYRAQALVIKNAPFGEADLLVTLYTREGGKLRALARGARRSGSRMVGHFEPLTVVGLSLARGRSLDTVTQVEVEQNFTLLKSQLSTMSRALYVAELVDGFGAESHDNQDLFQLAVDTLAAMEREPQRDLVLRCFELHLLRVSGFMPELFQCVECSSPLLPEQHRFSPDAGGTLCFQCAPAGVLVRPLSVRALKVLRLLHRSRVAQLPPLELGTPLEQELKSLLGGAVNYWLDKEIRSNLFLEHLEGWAAAEVPS